MRILRGRVPKTFTLYPSRIPPIDLAEQAGLSGPRSAHMGKHVLGVSWLHGRFQAVSLRGATVLASWTSPRPVANDSDFGPALDEAIRETKFTGNRVALLLDHRSMLYHVQDTPPAKGRVLHQLLERLVAQNHFFEEHAIWSHAPLPPAKGRQRFLLALVPESLMRQISDACSARRLQLTAVYPMAAALRDQLRQFSIQPDEVAILAADLGHSLHLLLGRGDGQVLFTRSVVLSAAQQPERAVQEINRTLHYAQQQFAASVSQLFVFGEGAFAHFKDLQIRQGLVAHPSPTDADAFFYARQAGSLPPKLSLNLVSQNASPQRQSRQLAAAAVAALLIAASVTAVRVELLLNAREQHAKSRTHEIESLTQSQAAVLTRQHEGRRLTAFLNLVGSTNEPPIIELFARFLPTAIPEDIRLAEASVVRGTNGWEFHLEGFVSEKAGGYLGILDRFEDRLRRSIFRPQLTDSTHQRLMGGKNADRPAPRLRSAERDGEKPFFVTGVIQ